MKAKLLKQIRKRFDIKIKNDCYYCLDKKTGIYYRERFFSSFIFGIGEILGRFFEFSQYASNNQFKYKQRILKNKYNKL